MFFRWNIQTVSGGLMNMVKRRRESGLKSTIQKVFQRLPKLYLHV